MNKAIYFFVALAVITGMLRLFMTEPTSAPLSEETIVTETESTMCTMDALQCPDGSYVGRTGPNCEFICPELPAVPEDVQAMIDAKRDVIQLTAPIPNGLITSPLIITGQARGYWFFEASFPVVLTNWDGLIIAEGYATAQGDWMTENFVPFTATLEFVSPYLVGNPDFMERGSLILQKDNPSGLPEHDDALEIPVRFTAE